MSGMQRRVWWRTAAALALLFLAGGMTPPAMALAPTSAAPAAVPPIAPGYARLWFYREFMPEDTQTFPTIYMNGTVVGYGGPGTSFYRDVPPGAYHLSVSSVGWDYNQEQNITVAPGELVYVKIASMPGWEEGGERSAWRQPTYYVMIVPPRLAALEMRFTAYTRSGL